MVPGCCAEEGATGGSRARAASTGTPRRDLPPAQGGIEILGKVDVVDVPVIIQIEFQQSSSSTEWLDIPVVPQ